VLRALNGLALGGLSCGAHLPRPSIERAPGAVFGVWVIGLDRGLFACRHNRDVLHDPRDVRRGVSALFYSVSIGAAVWRVRPPDPTPQKTASPWEVFLSKRSTFISVLIRHIGAHMIWAFWPLFLQQLGADYFWIGVTSAINTGTQFLVMYFLTDRGWSTGLLRLGLLLSSVTFITFALAPQFLVDPAHADTVGHLVGAAVRGGLAGGNGEPSQPWGCLGDLHRGIEHLDGHRAGAGSVACAHRGVLSAHLCRSRAVVRSVPLQTNQPCALPRERASPVRGLAQMSLQGGAPHAMLKP
jgi:hypothetical protein